MSLLEKNVRGTFNSLLVDVYNHMIESFYGGDFVKTIAYANHYVWSHRFLISLVLAYQVSDN